MTVARARIGGLLVAAAATLVLLATSHPRIVGDGVEYVAQAMNFASLHGPSLGSRDVARIERRLAALSGDLADWRIETTSVPGADRRRDFVHFWTYALMATPALWVTDAIGARPEYAFAAINVLMLGVGIWVLLPRLGAAATALIAGGPIIWWIDKAHTEIFTASLIAIALALMRERPGVALVAAGLAATQNLPIAALFAAIFIAHVIATRSGPAEPGTHARGTWNLAPGTEFVLGAAVGLALVLLQPAYTYARHGTASLLINSTVPGIPTPAELGAVLFDMNLGLVFCAPAFAAAVVLAILVVARRRPGALLTPEVVIAVSSGGVFLVAFASTVNVHHGGTPGISRYAIWLVPLAVPLFIEARATGDRTWRHGAIAAAVISSTMALISYHPARAEQSAQPSRIATWMWTAHPGWSNPLPEVFSEVLWREEGTRVPTATANCEKVLLASSDRADAHWPIPCEPAPMPDWCLATGEVCYANRNPVRDGYAFVPVHVRPRSLEISSGVWPHAAESHLRHWFAERGWRSLRRPAGGLDVLRAGFGVSTIPLGDASRFIVVLNKPEAGAAVAFRLPGRATGELLDPIAGTAVQPVNFDGPAGELWTLKVPAGYDILVLEMHGVIDR